MKHHEGFTLVLLMMMMRAVTSLTCHPAEYQVGWECCRKCPAGTLVYKNCTGFQSTSCMPCNVGTYMEKPTGETQCHRCRTCPSGFALKERTACSSSSNTVCGALEGYFCTEEEDGNCWRAQENCESGEFIQKLGTFSKRILSRCQPHTRCKTIWEETLKEGTLVSDTECGESNKFLTIVISVGAVILVICGFCLLLFLFWRRILLNNRTNRRNVMI